MLRQDELAAMDRSVADRIAAAGQFALDSPLPPAGALLDHVFA